MQLCNEQLRRYYEKMQPLAQVLAILALFRASAQTANISTNSTEYNSGIIRYPMIPEKIEFSDHSFLFMTCKITASQHFCNVTMDNRPSGGALQQCNITLDQLYGSAIRFERLGSNKALCHWRQWVERYGIIAPEPFKISLINMDDCSELRLDFPFDDKRGNLYDKVVVNRKSFHVYTPRSKLCGEYDKCILRYNNNGERVGQPLNISLGFPIQHLAPVNWSDPEKGAFAMNYRWTISDQGSKDLIVRAFHVNGTGFAKRLFSYPKPSLTNDLRCSSEHGYITACHFPSPPLGASKVQCLQYDATGREMTMNATVDMARNDTRMASVFNLREGGAILVSYGHAGGGRLMLHFEILNADGRVARRFEVSGSEGECSPPNFSDFGLDHAETESEHCFYYVCTRRPAAERSEDFHDEAVLEHVSKCFDKKAYFNADS